MADRPSRRPHPHLQATFYQHMAAAAAANEASSRLLAYPGRPSPGERGRPQLYGTQFVSDDTGALRPQPIDHPETLDERRSVVRMEPFVEYEATMHRIWAREPD